jgi:Na+-transporting NADH:ubiquinone oxidoreductase subunit NqrB
VQDFDYGRAIGRIERLTAVLSVAGMILLVLLRDWRHALAFAAGSLLAYASFWMIKRVVNAVSPESGGEGAKSTATGMALRYLVIGATVFGIMKFTGISAWPVFAGLMTTVMAVFAEIVYELTTAN